MTEPKPRRIFVLGDSRTGTMSLHRFLTALGFSSVHYFVDAAEQLEPDHEHHEENWRRARQFIEESGYEAFSDYPVRLFRRELLETYPDASFILTVRRDVDTWQRSMTTFFSNFDIELNMEQLTVNYLDLNEEIRQLFGSGDTRFLEVCIDDDSTENSGRIKEFLGVESPIQMGWENKSAAYDNDLLSHRGSLFDTASPDVVGYVESVNAPYKGMLSEFGWVYLVNEKSAFLRRLFHGAGWSDQETDRVRELLQERVKWFAEQDIPYLHFVIPEKAAVYPEFLPRVFAPMEISDQRPAEVIRSFDLDCYWYLADYLRDAKSYGQLYFRGDTHTSFLGAYLVYYYLVSKINSVVRDKSTRAPLELSDLQPELASYDGDIAGQLPPVQQQELQDVWGFLRNPVLFESMVRYQIPAADRTAVAQPVPSFYTEAFTKRETLIFETPDRGLPRAVIFRDSTCDLCLDFLAEHFSRSVFVWRNGEVIADVVRREQPDIVIHMMAERFTSAYPAMTALSAIR